MKISTEYPPNYEDFKKHFPVEEIKPIFTWGDTIYNPFHQHVTEDIEVHEAVHMIQQAKTSPGEWCNQYLDSLSFRLQQEAEAYGAQYRFLRNKYADRNQQTRCLHTLASCLSGKLYGSIITLQQAKQFIEHYAA